MAAANFPARLVGAVANASQSQVASGQAGLKAERLLGKGDFLLVTNQDHPVRFQAPEIRPGDFTLVERGAGKRPAFWRDPVGGRPAYFVPQAALCDPAHFMHLLRLPVADEMALAVERSAVPTPRRQVPLLIAANRLRAEVRRQ